jgi:hypothetical protein
LVTDEVVGAFWDNLRQFEDMDPGQRGPTRGSRSRVPLEEPGDYFPSDPASRLTVKSGAAKYMICIVAISPLL